MFHPCYLYLIWSWKRNHRRAGVEHEGLCLTEVVYQNIDDFTFSADNPRQIIHYLDSLPSKTWATATKHLVVTGVTGMNVQTAASVRIHGLQPGRFKVQGARLDGCVEIVVLPAAAPMMVFVREVSYRVVHQVLWPMSPPQVLPIFKFSASQVSGIEVSEAFFLNQI